MSAGYLDMFKNDTTAFVKELNGPNQQKVAEAAGLFIAQLLRERSFARQILTPRVVTRYDLKNSIYNDQLVFIDEKEVNVSPAQAINFKAEPDNVYITTPVTKSRSSRFRATCSPRRRSSCWRPPSR